MGWSLRRNAEEKEKDKIEEEKMNIDALKKLLIEHEGLRLKPYRCTSGRLTIGVGRNLEDVGISQDEAEFMLLKDIERVIASAEKDFTWFSRLNESRKIVILSMIFNLGSGGFKQFKKMIAALEEGNFSEAAVHMRDSLWAKQVGSRAEKLAQMMIGGDG